MATATIARTPQQVAADGIASLSHIATLPEITLRIINLVENPNSSAQDMHKVISSDPALCSRILKVVNSAFYGLPRQIGSINRAVVLLGLNAIKNIAIATSLAKLFRGGDISDRFSARDLWMHSLATAAASKLLADRLQFGLGDEAFLAGLIHDIGIVVELQIDRNKFVEVFDKMNFDESGAPASEMLEAEQQVFRATHQDFGRSLCESWKFPKSFGFVAGNHHNPLEIPAANRPLTLVVHVADCLVARAGICFRGDLTSLDPLPEAIRDLNLKGEILLGIQNDLPAAIAEVEASFTA